MNFPSAAAELRRQEFSRLSAAVTPRIEAFRSMTADAFRTETRIDRLARSTFDLFAIVKQIVDAKAQFRSLAEPWADTGTSTGRLMIAVLGGLADVERDLIPPAPPRAAVGRRSSGSAWAGNRN